jgi:hypothetical protein
MVLEIPARAIRQEKEIEEIQVSMKEGKLSPLADSFLKRFHQKPPHS